MRKFILIIIFSVSTICLFSQNVHKVTIETCSVQDSLKNDTLQDIPKQYSVEEMLEKQLNETNAKLKLQQEQLLELQNIKAELMTAENKNKELNMELEFANRHAETVEKSLISMASNFLYIPYEAYGVEEIAVKAFEKVQNEELKNKYHERYVLLKNYRQHLIDFKAYLERVQKVCNGVFQATATEFIEPTDPNVSSDLVLKLQPFYLEYIKYDDYKETFIGKLLEKTEMILRAHTKRNRANLQSVVAAIDRTQKPVKMDSVNDIIDVIDERLKTIDDL